MKQNKSNKRKVGFSISQCRRSKADKIMKVLDEKIEIRNFPKKKKKLLDIGAGNGEIAGYLSEHYNVVSVDIADKRIVKNGFVFVQTCGEDLPFFDGIFDIVVVNHVIEHVADAGQLLSEISRVLNDDGVVYLSTPNRLWPWEVHKKFLFLHYLPTTTFNFLLRRRGKNREDIFLLTWWTLRRMASKYFYIYIVSHRVCKWPHYYHIKCHTYVEKMLSLVPLKLFQMFKFIHPTLIMVLKIKK